MEISGNGRTAGTAPVDIKNILKNMINIQQLQFHYPQGDFFLNIPELTIKDNERVVFIGPSGSGKTTLLNLIAGIVMPLKGHVTVGHNKISSFDEATRRAYRIEHIGQIFQTFELLSYLSVIDNILLPARINPVLKVTPDLQQQAKNLLQKMDLQHKCSHYPQHLSQGEKQRVALCRALLMKPSLLLADEPTGNLDVFNKEKALHLLLDFASTHQATLVVVTHDQSMLEYFDRVIDFQDFLSRQKQRLYGQIAL